MKKKTKTMMTTMGILCACAGIGAGTYMYMQNNKKKIQKAIEKYMTYPEDMR